MFCALWEIADVSLGYKSLQNNFFYINEATVDSFGVEEKYLTPVLMLKDFDASKFLQSPTPNLWLFNCKDALADIRGTGAARYIEAMADRTATEKKQTGKAMTIRQALEAQSGRLWYSPKARPNRHHVWLRKGIGGVFAPFLSETPILVDQRCNSIAPIAGLDWRELAGLMSSSLFAYSVEVNGAAGMGAGVLEARTTEVRKFPVVDLRVLTSAQRGTLVELAERVWNEESPVDWTSVKASPGSHLQELDAWLLQVTRRNVPVETLYRDLKGVALARVHVANDKVRVTKKRRTDNVGNVADSIVAVISPKLLIRNFPDDFVGGAERDINLHFDRDTISHASLVPLLADYELDIVGRKGAAIYAASHPRAVAESIVRSLLWGRSIFSVSSSPTTMEKAISDFLKWAREIEADIDLAIRESALGTGYEETLKMEVYRKLGINRAAGDVSLPSTVIF